MLVGATGVLAASVLSAVAAGANTQSATSYVRSVGFSSRSDQVAPTLSQLRGGFSMTLAYYMGE